MNNKILILALAAVFIAIGVTACIILKQGEKIREEHPLISRSGTGQEIYYAPIIDVEATIVSVSPDINQECEDKCPGYIYPRDKGVILIDKVFSVRYPSPRGGQETDISENIEGFEAGSEVQVDFLYSSRPAKVRYIPAPVTGSLPSGTTASRSLNQPIPRENGYFIYIIETTLVDQPTEVVLSGLEVGLRIRANVSYKGPSRGSISIYEILD